MFSSEQPVVFDGDLWQQHGAMLAAAYNHAVRAGPNRVCHNRAQFGKYRYFDTQPVDFLLPKRRKAYVAQRRANGALPPGLWERAASISSADAPAQPAATVERYEGSARFG